MLTQARTKTEQADHHLGVGGTGQMYGVGCVHTLPFLYFGFRKCCFSVKDTATIAGHFNKNAPKHGSETFMTGKDTAICAISSARGGGGVVWW